MGVLAQATERLEVNDRTRGECFNALKNTVQNEKLITHALVFVGTKLLVSYSRGITRPAAGGGGGGGGGGLLSAHVRPPPCVRVRVR